MDVNTAPRELLLRIPGVGVRSVNRIVAARRHRRVRYDDLMRLRVSRERAMPFIITTGFSSRHDSRPTALTCATGSSSRSQFDLFTPAQSAHSGEL